MLAVIGSGWPANVVPPDFDGTLLADGTIRLWLARRKHLPAQALIASTLTAALKSADSHARGLALAELPATTSTTMQRAA